MEAMMQQSGSDTPQAITMRRLYAGWLAGHGRNDEAREQHRAMLDSAGKVFGSNPAAQADLLAELARQDLGMGERAEARAHVEAAIGLRQADEHRDEKALAALTALLQQIDAETDTGAPAPQ